MNTLFMLDLQGREEAGRGEGEGRQGEGRQGEGRGRGGEGKEVGGRERERRQGRGGMVGRRETRRRGGRAMRCMYMYTGNNGLSNCTIDSLEWILQEGPVPSIEHLLNPKRHDSPHIVNGLHSCLATLLQLLLVLCRPTSKQAELKEAK